MDFVRRVLWVLCFSLLGVGSASASGRPARNNGQRSESATAPTALGVLSAANIAQPAVVLAKSDVSTATYYGAPFYFSLTCPTTNGPIVSVGGPESSVDGAAQSWANEIAACNGVSECPWEQIYASGDASSGGAFDYLNPNGNDGVCLGTSVVWGTAFNSDIGDNIGDGGGCDGGEGRNGGGGGSGAGGSGASSEASCADNKGAPMAGDPINTSTGNKYLQDDDYPDAGWLTFRRFYNSASRLLRMSISKLQR